MNQEIVPHEGLLAELRELIQSAQSRVAVSVNRELVLLYWDVGQRLRVQVLGSERAEYGERIVPTLSAQWAAKFGDGFSKRNVFRMVKFAETFPERAMVEKLSDVLSWSHFIEVLALRQPVERDFNASMCHASKWSVRGLRKEIAEALFARTALARQDEQVMRSSLESLRDEDR